VAPLKKIYRRMVADFLMPSRLAEYRATLGHFVEQGYQFLTVDAYASHIAKGTLWGLGPVAVLRQDVDTDVATARAMWRIEQELGVQASRYFRLSTFDSRLMQEIDAAGGEASYHFEEMATFAKKRRIKSAQQLRHSVDEIVPRFEDNLARMRGETGLAMTTVASHGDFVNRRLGVYNHELLACPEVRQRLGVANEVYDAALAAPVEARYCDRPYHQKWDAGDPRSITPSKARVVYLLVHPRHWRASPACNLYDDAGRIWEAVRYAA